VYADLDDNLGATMSTPWFRQPSGFEARRFDMDNGDTALLAWTDDEAYWVGNTETPSALWRTDKIALEAAPEAVTEWAERELLAELHEESPWLKPYPHLSWFYLPVFCSKDGRETTRAFFSDHAAGFPDCSSEAALDYYESFLSTGVLDPYRELTAGKLGTSRSLDLVRMSAAMGELDAAKLLHDAGYALEPEAAVTTGHSLDFRVEKDDRVTLVEVTRPLPPNRRAANSPVAAVRDTAQTKTDGQLSEHAGGAVLFVDCSSFPDDDWRAVLGERPEVRHRPAVVFRVHPGRDPEGYTKGSLPLDLSF
jgi:hypothetical protein